MHDDDQSKSKGPNAVNIAGRTAAMALAVASAALMATASQCTVVFQFGAPAHTVTYSDFGPFVYIENFRCFFFPRMICTYLLFFLSLGSVRACRYLVAANAMAAILEGIAIFLSVWRKGKDSKSRVLLPLLDAAVPALLYSSTGAAFAAGEYMSYCAAGGRRVSFCSGAGGTRGNFCSQVHMSVYISLAAAAAVSAAEVAKNMPLSLGGSGSSDSSTESDCEGCPHRH